MDGSHHYEVISLFCHMFKIHWNKELSLNSRYVTCSQSSLYFTFLFEHLFFTACNYKECSFRYFPICPWWPAVAPYGSFSGIHLGFFLYSYHLFFLHLRLLYSLAMGNCLLLIALIFPFAFLDSSSNQTLLSNPLTSCICYLIHYITRMHHLEV